MALGLHKVSPTARAQNETADDDFVARHGLSYGETRDPISKEAHLEVERLKSVRPPRK
jgi:hypothetical protein